MRTIAQDNGFFNIMSQKHLIAMNVKPIQQLYLSCLCTFVDPLHTHPKISLSCGSCVYSLHINIYMPVSSSAPPVID